MIVRIDILVSNMFKECLVFFAYLWQLYGIHDCDHLLSWKCPIVSQTTPSTQSLDTS